jgi:hypothetical protein
MKDKPKFTLAKATLTEIGDAAAKEFTLPNNQTIGEVIKILEDMLKQSPEPRRKFSTGLTVDKKTAALVGLTIRFDRRTKGKGDGPEDAAQLYAAENEETFNSEMLDAELAITSTQQAKSILDEAIGKIAQVGALGKNFLSLEDRALYTSTIRKTVNMALVSAGEMTYQPKPKK